MTSTMREAQYQQHGPPEVLEVREVPVPDPGPGEVRVRVRAASVGGGEAPIRAGAMRHLLRARAPYRIGNDFAGRVDAVGPGVERFVVGDPVWGLVPARTFGSTAEYVAVPESLLARAPRTLGLVEAAALPSSGTTAVSALVDHAGLRAGERLLVRGATGGVGSLAVQLGRSLGAHVTALASARHLDRVRDLGADVALDYRTTDPASLPRYDVVLDTVGTDLGSYRKRLAPGGRLVILAMDPDHLTRSVAYLLWGTTLGRRQVRAFSNKPSTDQVVRLTELVEAGTIRPVVDQVFPLDEVVAAHRRIEAGGVLGKLVVSIGPDA